MKISLDSGTVVCSLENKNSEFLSTCTGLFDGFLNGNLKMRWENQEEWYEPDGAMECNAETLKYILIYAKVYGIEVDVTVEEFNTVLQVKSSEIKARERAEEEYQKAQEIWQNKCCNGCGKCKELAYNIDLPICKQTGEILKEKNVQKHIGGVLRLFNFEPFPSENCPFNISKKQGEHNEHLREYCGSTS